MNNQGWPDERCAACGLKAKLNMGCGSGEPLYIRLRPCSRCKEVRYCNRECQLKHWKAGHKNVCVKAGDKPPPPMAEELRTAVAAQIAKRGCYILAHAPGHSGDAPLGPDDPINIHTIGFYECGAAELVVPKIAHRLLQRAGGLLAYVRNERPVDQPLKDGDSITVNGLTFKAAKVEGEALKAANADGVLSVRAFYYLKKSDGLVPLIQLTLDREDDMPAGVPKEITQGIPNDDLEHDPTAIAEKAAKDLAAAKDAAAQAALDAQADAAPPQVGEVAAPKEPYPDWETVPVEAQ